MIKKQSLMRKKHNLGYLYIMPFIIGFILIFLPSIFQSLQYSIYNVSFGTEGIKMVFAGLDNFKKAFLEDVNFRVIFLDSIQRMSSDIIVITIFSFFIATVLNQRFRGRSIARTVFFLPVILATGIIASIAAGDPMLGSFMNNTGNEISSGFSDSNVMNFFNLEALLLQSNISSGLVTFIVKAIDNIFEVVNASGVQILVFLVGLQSIPVSVFEASKVEGATKWEEFWKITFPMMGPIILVNMIYSIIDTFTRPTYGILSFIQNTAFKLNQMGYAAAIGWIYFLFIIIIMALVWLVSKRLIHYEN